MPESYSAVGLPLPHRLALAGIPLILGIGGGWATATYRDLATAGGLNDGLAILITLNAVVSGLTYALMGKAAMLKGRTAEGESFRFAVAVMVSCSLGGSLAGIVHIAWSPDWTWLLPITSGLLVGAPSVLPVLAIQEERSKRAEVDALLNDFADEGTQKRADKPDESVLDDPRILRVRPREFLADPSDPFENDVLERKGQVKAFCSIITGIDTPAVLSVDAPWGTGKTAFMRMCAAWIRSKDSSSEGAFIAEFNAWKQNHTGSALKDIVAAVTSQIAELDDTQQRVATILRRQATKLASGGLIPDEVFVIGEGPNAHVGRFRENLRAFAESRGGRMIVFVDELDRCRPEYAMAVLECLRHLFDTRGVLVVLTVNQQALNEAVMSLHGLEDTERYLRRFVDQTIWLPVADRDTTNEFLRSLWDDTGLGERFRERNWTNLVFEMLLELPNTSLRDIEQSAYRVATVFASIPQRDSSDDQLSERDHLWVWEMAALGLIVLRETHRDTYKEFSDGTKGVFDVAHTLSQAFPNTPTLVLERIERALLATTQNGVEPLHDDETRSQYHAGRRGEYYDKERERYEREHGWHPARLPDIETVFNVIEMVNSGTEGSE